MIMLIPTREAERTIITKSPNEGGVKNVGKERNAGDTDLLRKVIHQTPLRLHCHLHPAPPHHLRERNIE